MFSPRDSDGDAAPCGCGWPCSSAATCFTSRGRRPASDAHRPSTSSASGRCRNSPNSATVRTPALRVRNCLPQGVSCDSRDRSSVRCISLQQCSKNSHHSQRKCTCHAPRPPPCRRIRTRSCRRKFSRCGRRSPDRTRSAPAASPARRRRSPVHVHIVRRLRAEDRSSSRAYSSTWTRWVSCSDSPRLRSISRSTPPPCSSGAPRSGRDGCR